MEAIIFLLPLLMLAVFGSIIWGAVKDKPHPAVDD
jgi:hypothetical protein